MGTVIVSLVIGFTIGFVVGAYKKIKEVLTKIKEHGKAIIQR